MKKRRLIVPAVFAIGVAYYFIAGSLEAKRIATPLSAGAVASGPDIDVAALMKDLQTLASPRFAGRKTGSEGSRLAQAYLIERFTQLGLAPFGNSYASQFSFTHTSVKRTLTPGVSGKTEYPFAINLIGQIKGTARPDQILLISAHYDHLGVRDGVTYPGADDNASGVGAMLAVAAYFKAHPPANTVVFAAFDGEELGLRGAQAMLAAPPFPMQQLKMNLNLDMVGRNDNNEIFVAGTSYTPMLKDLVAAAASGSALKVKLGHDRPMAVAGNVEDWTNSSDHGPFHAAGVPFLYFGVEDHADYHGPGDTADKIKPAFYGEAARLVVRTAAALDRQLGAIK